jgi:hypothetical protein
LIRIKAIEIIIIEIPIKILNWYPGIPAAFDGAWSVFDVEGVDELLVLFVGVVVDELEPEDVVVEVVVVEVVVVEVFVDVFIAHKSTLSEMIVLIP